MNKLYIFILGIVSLNNAFADLEPANNTIYGAEILNINTTVSGSVIALDNDYYSLTTTEDGNITFSFNSDSPTYTVAYFRDAAGNSLSSLTVSNSSGTLSNVIYQAAAGTYYIWILGNDEATYSLSTSLVSPTIGNDQEPNDNAENALVLASNDTASGHIGYRSTYGIYDVIDFYEINMPLDGDLSIHIENDLGDYIILNLYDQNGTTYINGLGDAGQPGFDFNLVALEAGTYYIRVSIDLGTQYCGYQFSWSTTPTAYLNDVEPNDGFDTATLINLDETNTLHLMHRRHGGSYDLADFYKVELQDNGNLSVTISNENNNNIIITLYEGDGTTYINSAYGLGQAGVVLTVSNLEAGLYYIKVHADLATQYSGYQFSASYTTDVIDVDAEIPFALFPNPAMDHVNLRFTRSVNGMPIFRIINMQGEVCFNNRMAVSPGNATISIPVADLPAGIYVLQMIDNGNVTESKFIK